MMWISRYIKVSLLTLLIVFISCSPVVTDDHHETNESIESNNSQSTEDIETPTSLPFEIIDDGTMDMEPTIEATITPLPLLASPSPYQADTPKSCPIEVEDNEVLSLFEGSILFSNDLGIWYLSKERPNPSLLLESLDGENAAYFLSGDMSILLKFVYPQDGQEANYMFYDLSNQKLINNGLTLQLMRVLGWQDDGRIAMLNQFDRILGVGEQQKILLIDPTDNQIETVEINLEIPNYQFFQEPLYNGLASTDPKQERALYTLWSDQDFFAVALRDLKANNNIWEERILFPPYPFPEPVWSSSGEYVIFNLYVNEGGKDFNKLVLLNREGKEESLPSQPFPSMMEWLQVQTLSLSPDERYIHYDLGHSNMNGPGFIVDRALSTARQICDQNAQKEFLDGMWLNEELFLYRLKGTDEDISLHLLNVSNWTTQLLTELGSKGYGWSALNLQ